VNRTALHQLGEARNDAEYGSEEAYALDGAGAEYLTLAGRVYAELETCIIGGIWLPGTKVSLRKVAASIQTSVQPVRQAVGRLVDAGALELSPSRFVRVPVLDRSAADEVWGLRLLLEGEVVAKFAARSTPAEIKQLFTLSEGLRASRYGVDIKRTMEAIRDWNVALAEGTRSPLLIDAVSKLRLRYSPFIADCMSADARRDDEFTQFTLHMQDELILAISSGDVAGARHLRCADLRTFQRYLYSRKGWRF
jgi:DNA-binding GntR family transcriptional regulator